MNNASPFGVSKRTKWLVLPRLEVRSMNAQPAWWCVGAPGPMAVRGLAQALGEAAMGKGPDDIQGVAMVWHHFEMRGEYISSKPGSAFQDFFAHQHRAAALINDDDYASGSKTLSGQPTVRGDGTVTLILAVDARASIDLVAIEQRLNVGRLAGGSIVDHQFRVPKGDRQVKSPQDLLIHEEWTGVMKRVRTGHAFVDRSELVQEAMAAGAADPLEAFLACTQPLGRAGSDAPKDASEGFARPRSSWLAPYLAGYYGLTAASERRMSRDAHPHAFVEPLVGLGQFLSIRDSGVIPFWDYAAGEDGTYRIHEVNCFGGTKPAAKAYKSRAAVSSPSKETQ
ncbi:MAG: type I-F CRISPR-associated protein Csy2 [Hydrogenophaga sp.]|nr:type I-F CRISPR-associated protein Csy2 [Hydrogenophaga sp.]